jgi:hypothetical protein
MFGFRVITHSVKHPDHESMRPPTTVGTGCTTPPKLATRSRARVPFRAACSDRETERAEEYKHLRGDAVYGAVDDADDGDREATRNVRHGILSFWGAPDESSWRPFWEQLSSDGRPRVRRSTPQLGAMPTTELMRPPTDGKTHGIPLFPEAGGRAWKAWCGGDPASGFQGKFRSFRPSSLVLAPVFSSAFGLRRVQALSC